MNYKTKIILFFLMATLPIGLLFTAPVIKAQETKPIILNLQVPIGDEVEVMDIGPNSIGTYIKAIYKYGVILGSTLAIIVIMIGGIIWLTSGGSPERVKNARTYIGGALGGLFLLLGSYMLLQTINPDLINFTPLNITPIKGVPLPSEKCAGKMEAPNDRCVVTNDPDNDNCGLEKFKNEKSIVTSVCCCGVPSYCKNIKKCEDYNSPVGCMYDLCTKNTSVEICKWNTQSGKCFSDKNNTFTKNCGDTYPQCGGLCMSPARCQKVDNSCKCQ